MNIRTVLFNSKIDKEKAKILLEYITGYDNDALHIRYVGQTDAKKMKDEHLSLDEYYAYYVIGDK